MGEVLELADHRLIAAQRAVVRLIAEVEVAPDYTGGDGHRPLALAALQVAAIALQAMADGSWPLQKAAAIMGEALADLAEHGPDDWCNNICIPAKALARAGLVDQDWPDPDFALLRDAISEVVERSDTFWQTNDRDQSQADVILRVAPIVAEVAADLALGRPMTRNPMDAIRAVV